MPVASPSAAHPFRESPQMRRADKPISSGLPAVTLFRASCVCVGSLPDVNGQTGSLRVVVGAEALVAYVHIGKAAVDLVGALVEPAADVLPVSLRGGHRLLAVRREA